MNSSRRKFLKGATCFGLLSSLELSAQTNHIYSNNKNNHYAKNLIFLIADGMGRGALSITNDYSKKILNKELNWIKLLKDNNVTTSLQNTASASSPVTDSAAAATAWASGCRVPNGKINVTSEGKHLCPIFSKAKQKGKSLGLVTSARITHATPAAFVSISEDRDDEYAIAKQYLKQEIDILLGGGTKKFSNRSGTLIEKFTAANYEYVTSLDSLKSARNAPKLLGLFSDSHLPYAIDRKNSKLNEFIPDLETMMEVALSNLSRCKSGFCLQVEAGRVDHAGHAQDISSLIQEQLEFDRCISIAVEFVSKNPDTLLIITTDHGTGGCQLNGIGENYSSSNFAMETISKVRASFESIADQLYINPGNAKNLFSSKLGINIGDDDELIIKSMLNDKYRIYPFGFREESDFDGHKKDYLAANLGSYFESYFSEKTGLSWTSDAHTSELVDLIAIGPGANEIPDYIENYQLHKYLQSALGII